MYVVNAADKVWVGEKRIHYFQFQDYFSGAYSTTTFHAIEQIER